jgi:hypothetical protein
MIKKFQPTDRQASRNWDVYYESFVKDVKAIVNETPTDKAKRIKKLEADQEAWKQYYFPKYIYAPAAPFHITASERELTDPELYEVRAWARELAKDVVEMMNTLYQVLAQRSKKNIMFISNSWDKAADLLKPFKINLERNERIISDYGIQQLLGSWKDGDFTTTQGVSFIAVGAGQSPRGTRNEEVRPDKVIISDIDTDEDVRNPDVIDKRWHWFEHAVYPTRSISKPSQFIWLGNIIAKDCCITRAMKKADVADVVNLEDKDGESTWPEKNKREHIDRIKSKISTKAYQTEYMNNPLSEGDIFKHMNWGEVPELKQFTFLVAYGDPAPSNSQNKKGSYKSVFLIGGLNGKFYVITGYLDHEVNAEFVEWYYRLRNYVDGKTQVYNYIENNKLQDPFYEQVFLPLFAKKAKETGKVLGIIPDTRSKPDKFSRIEGNLEPLNNNGQLILNIAEKHNYHMKRLEEQFKLVNPRLSSPADGPDCIEGGVWIVNEKNSQIKPDSIKICDKSWYKSKKF